MSPRGTTFAVLIGIGMAGGAMAAERTQSSAGPTTFSAVQTQKAVGPTTFSAVQTQKAVGPVSFHAVQTQKAVGPSVFSAVRTQKTVGATGDSPSATAASRRSSEHKPLDLNEGF